MNRFRAQISRVVAAVLATALLLPAPSFAQGTKKSRIPDLWFAGTRLIIAHPEMRGTEIAIGHDDDALNRVLTKAGAGLVYDAASGAVTLTTADHRVLHFALGDAHVSSGGITFPLPFAPYAEGHSAYLPFLALLGALGIYAVPDAKTRSVVLQPQISSIGVTQSGATTMLTVHSATPIVFKRISAEGDAHVSIALLGAGSQLAPDQVVGTPAVSGLSLAAGGAPRNPTVVLNIAGQAGARSGILPSGSQNQLVIAFALGTKPDGAQTLPEHGVSSDYAGPTAPQQASSMPVATPAPAAATPAAATPAAATPSPSPAPRGKKSSSTPPSPPPAGPSATASPQSLSEMPVSQAGDDTKPELILAHQIRPVPSPTPETTDEYAPSANTAAAPTPAPSFAPNGGASSAKLTAIDVAPLGAGAVVHLAIAGTASYQWHRLSDGRWYVDFVGTTLAMPARDIAGMGDLLGGVRVKQYAMNPPVVRVALSLATSRAVGLAGSPSGIDLTFAPDADGNAPRSGAGTFGPQGLVAQAAPLDPQTVAIATPTPPGSIDTSDTGSGAGKSSPLVAIPDGSGAGLAAGAALGGAGGILAGTTSVDSQPDQYNVTGTDQHMIVIDPGHGGSDAGSVHNGLVEKELTLDISKRLKALLVARGWQVKMTRDDDRDVFAPNDSAHDELQARDDVAIHAGARLFISIHVNAFTDSSQNGSTAYYFKSSDLALARAIHGHFASLGTADDGVIKANYYVIHHATMPAALIETAFDSNPGDAALLANPAWRQKMARAVADGIGDYVNNNSNSNGT